MERTLLWCAVSDKKTSRSPLAELLSLGITLAITVGIPTGIGIALDAAFNTGPLWLFVGLVVGCIVAVTTVRDLVKKNR